MTSPLLSVVMPVHNTRAFLDQSIASILNQTLTSFELVILDDASTDGSSDVAQNWARQDSRIVLHHSKHHLKGREAQGIVSPEEYAELCLDLENLMRSLKRDDGKPLARTVIRTAGQVLEALTSRIPDLVVHWEDEVFASPLRVQDFEVVTHPTGQKYVGQHSLDGFCILRGAEELHDGDSLHAKDIHRIIERSLVPEGDELSSRGQRPRKVTFQVRP